ncbi:MAG: DUF1905 domain-containing protein [Bacteroidetes bacterium]|nr:DUF1905 domain-containing protein [Bacteroidota bacterium]
MEKPLVNKKYLLEKFPGKGGWTYAAIPELKQDKKKPFGWVQVKGKIDSYELKSYKLMPMGDGKLFLPVKTEIRKKINKQQGDWVHVVLFADDEPFLIPEEFQWCLQDVPGALSLFKKYSASEQKAFIDWIYAAKTDPTKVKRIALSLEKISRGLKLYDSLA